METLFGTPPRPPGCRWNYAVAQKRALLSEAVGPGASISAVTRKYGIAPNIIFQ